MFGSMGVLLLIICSSYKKFYRVWIESRTYDAEARQLRLTGHKTDVECFIINRFCGSWDNH